MIYDFNLKNLIGNILPTGLRTNILNYFNAQLLVLNDLYAKFINLRTNSLQSLRYACTYPDLQRLLNDKFRPVDRDIKVYDGEVYQVNLIYPMADEVAFVTPKVITPNIDAICSPFNVSLPNCLIVDADKMRQLTKIMEIYKLTGTNYKIINHG